MTADDIADMLRLNAAHVRDRLTKERGFPNAYRIGKSLRWSADEVEDWVKSRAVSPVVRRSKKRTPRSRSVASSGQSDQPSGQADADQESLTAA